MTYSGSCHCGKIAFDVEGKLDQAMDCNCSMCRRRGGLLWFVPRADLKLKTLEANLGTYTFNKHNLQHHFCRTCGIAPFSEGTHPKTGQPMAAVNVRCLNDVDLKALKIVPIDGASL